MPADKYGSWPESIVNQFENALAIAVAIRLINILFLGKTHFAIPSKVKKLKENDEAADTDAQTPSFTGLSVSVKINLRHETIAKPEPWNKSVCKHK